MKYKNYTDALRDLKEEDFDGSLLLTVGDIEQRMVAVWTRVKRCEAEHNVLNDGVHEAWSYVCFDARSWAMLARLPEMDIWSSWQGLARSNIIYPDGTLPEEVEEYIKNKVVDLFGEKM